MSEHASENSQKIAARVAGFTLLLLIASGLFASFVAQNHLVVSGDAAETAHNLMVHERRFRVGIATQIVMLNCDIVLALALYALLKPVNSTLALLGTFWRVANAIVLGVGVSASLVALHLLGGAFSLPAFKPDQLQALAMLFFDTRSKGSNIGLMFFCLGAAVHAYLLFKSAYIPRILSGLYLFAAIQLLISFFVVLIFPSLSVALSIGFLMPDLIAELLVASWLSFKGVDLHPKW